MLDPAGDLQGGDAFLAKPFSPDELARTVGSMLAVRSNRPLGHEIPRRPSEPHSPPPGTRHQRHDV
jgi:DNA-binding response OmpR family regulator